MANDDILGNTRITFSQSGNLPAEEYEKGLRQGWNTFFDRLEQLLQNTNGKSD